MAFNIRISGEQEEVLEILAKKLGCKKIDVVQKALELFIDLRRRSRIHHVLLQDKVTGEMVRITNWGERTD